MQNYISTTILGYFLERIVTVDFDTGLWLVLFVLIASGLVQLAFSIVTTIFLKAPAAGLIVMAAGLATLVLLAPRSSLFWMTSLAIALLAALVALYVRAWKQRDRLDQEFDDLTDHVIMIDQEGRGLNIRPTYLAKLLPIPHFTPCEKEDYRVQIDTIIKKVCHREPTQRYDRVVIFVHGGLNDYQNALALSAERLQKMKDEQERIYPIFILWRSGLLPCYWSHLTEFRHGRTPLTSWYGRVALAISNLAGDLGRGVSRFPRTAYYQALSDLTLIDPGFENDATNVPELYKRLRQLFVNSNQPAIRLKKKDDERDPDQDVWLSRDPRLMFELLNPVKLAVRYSVWPLLDALGTSAWNIMLRRTRTLFRSPYEFDVTQADKRQTQGRHPYAPEPYDPDGTSRFRQMLDTQASGALAIFIRAISAAQSDMSGDTLPEHVTLIGHSMGAIVLNNWLEVALDFRATEVVYMAPACRIDDALEVIDPYLQRSEATFHVLCLHPKAERSEQHAFGLSPLGSLLEWIDNFFSTPLTFDQRTLGKWDNILQSTHLIDPSIRSRVHLKAFSIRSDQVDLTPGEIEACRREQPERIGIFEGRAILSEALRGRGAIRTPIAHAEFTSCRFWRPAFYTVSDERERVD